MQSLPGFRDFPPEECALRDDILSMWRDVARRYGFVEYDGPAIESVDLYAKKNESAAEILQQLYRFTDRGGREIALRPEMTPTLARMVAAREKHYRKPLKWFSIASFFRYERQQKGRLREFIQLNCDLIGEDSAGADAEVIALVIDLLRAFGFTAADFVVRVSDRRVWTHYLAGRGVAAESMPTVLEAADKLEREPVEKLDARLAPFGLRAADLREFIAGGMPEAFAPLMADLSERGMAEFVEHDLSIVRGLAYYTGLVFEVFDRSKSMRALAGGGRYDDLISGLSDGAANLPAMGFGMGDVVLANLIEETPAASEARAIRLAARPACDVYVVIADESRRPEMLRIVQSLRSAGWRTDYPLGPARVGKQFQTAEGLGAAAAVVIGAEWPTMNVKILATREEAGVQVIDLAGSLERLLGPRRAFSTPRPVVIG